MLNQKSTRIQWHQQQQCTFNHKWMYNVQCTCTLQILKIHAKLSLE